MLILSGFYQVKLQPILLAWMRGLAFWKLSFGLEDTVVRIAQPCRLKGIFDLLSFYSIAFGVSFFPILQGSLDRYSNWKHFFLNQSNSFKHEIVIWFFKFILDVFEFAKLQNFVKWISKIVHSSRVILSILWKVAFSTIFSCWPAQHYIRRPGEHRH